MKVAYKYRIYPNKEQEKQLMNILSSYNLLYNIAVDIVKTYIVREQRKNQSFSTNIKDEDGNIIIDEKTGEPKKFPKYKFPSKFNIVKMIYHLKDEEDCEYWNYVTSEYVLNNKEVIKERLRLLPANCFNYIAVALRTAIDQKFNKKVAKRSKNKKVRTFTIDGIEEVDRTNLFYHKFNWRDCKYTYQCQHQSALKVGEGKKAYFNIMKVGIAKMIYHRPIPMGSKFDAVTISRVNNEWYVALGGLELPTPDVINKDNVKSSVGIDINTDNYIVTSDNETFKNPIEKIKKLKKAIKRMQRRCGENKKDAVTKSKRDYKSNNFKKYLLKKSKKELKVVRIKKEMLNNTTSYLTHKYDVIFTENLNVKAMQKFNGKMTQKNNFYELFRQLDYKALKVGKIIHKVDRFYASSQICSKCGKVHPEMKKLSKRVFRCECGNIMARDLNAAINIKNEGIKSLYNGE